LLARLIHTYNWPTGIIGAFIDIQNILHGGHEFAAASGGDTPALTQMRLQLVFLSA
jgi:hypothetical protein